MNSRQENAMGRCLVSMLIALLCIPAPVMAQETFSQPLFKIERSKNANIVQYDAQLDSDGKLAKKHPVVVYWVRHAEQGQTRKLSWLQKTFAYGFKTQLDPGRERVELRMVAEKSRPIVVIRAAEEYRATIEIDGSLSYLEKIYIDASRKRISVSVNSIELFGLDVETGEARYEKFVP